MSEDQRPPTYEELAALVQSLQSRVAELEARLGLNSKNSSKPSSSDVFVKPKSLRRRSGRKPGGQDGHQGTTLRQVAEPDHVIEHRPHACSSCGEGLESARVTASSVRQVFDLPEQIVPEVTEHRLVSCRCDCGQVTAASAPAGVTAPVQYGPGIGAIATYLYEGQFLSKERTAQALEELFACPVSTATVEALANRAAAAIAASGFAQTAAQILASSGTVHVDETGMRVEGKLAWLHVACTASVALFLAHPGRGREAMKAMGVLTRAVGIVHHDCWAPYDHDDFDLVHQLCGAHLLRELQAVCDSAGGGHDDGACWACGSRFGLLGAKRLVDAAALAATGKDRIDPAAIAAARHAFISAAWMGLGATERRRSDLEKKHHALARRMIERFKDYWRFTHDPWAVFDNNAAEREIRMTKIKNKVSGGLRSMHGAERYAMLRSYLHTARKHGVSFMNALRSASAGTPWLIPTT